jgi:hypothetical protein
MFINNYLIKERKTFLKKHEENVTIFSNGYLGHFLKLYFNLDKKEIYKYKKSQVMLYYLKQELKKKNKIAIFKTSQSICDR